MANSKALQASGITAKTPDPLPGEIVKDPKTGAPTGLLRNAAQLLKVVAPSRQPSTQEQRDSLKNLFKLYNQQGITSIAERRTEFASIDLFRELARAGELTLRVNCTRMMDPVPKTLEEAMYRQVGASEVSRCFGCHTTASNIGGQFQESNLILGVSCEACHGTGAKHVETMKASKLAGVTDSVASMIFNPRQLSSVDSVDFCGACHGTWWDTKLAGVKGPSNARSQPYRLQNSKCWGKGDARLTCIACHDPHQQLQTDPPAYDGACLSCHLSSMEKSTKPTPDHPGAACPIAKKDCITCHMPKVYVPEMHHNFTDHRIRIVHPNEPYPE